MWSLSHVTEMHAEYTIYKVILRIKSTRLSLTKISVIAEISLVDHGMNRHYVCAQNMLRRIPCSITQRFIVVEESYSLHRGTVIAWF